MKRTRPTTQARLGILTAILIGLTASWPLEAADTTAHPNVIFVLVDDLRWDALGYAGHPFLQTPNIDRIAKEGVNFCNAFVSTPLCSPSRASYLTGQYAHTHGQQGNGGEAGGGHNFVTFPLLMHQAGYTTAYVGKWHMGNDDTARPGFSHWVSFKGQGDYINPSLNVNGEAVQTKGYVTDILTDHAVDFLKQKHDKPFLLYLSHKAVHSGFTPAERHQNEFADKTIPRAPSVQDTLEGKPVLTRELPQPERQGENPGTEDRAVLGQLRGILAIDEGVGRLFKTLEETRQLHNTLVIFTSDNGFFWGEHGRGDKRMAYEESIRVPLVMRHPGLIDAGSIRDQLVVSVDIAPTLLELAGVAMPKEMHGRSLVPVLKGEVSNWRQSILTEYFGGATNRIPSWQSVRTERWKYIHYTQVEGVDELYDLKSDRYELNNLIDKPEAQATLSDMKLELARLLAETGSDGSEPPRKAASSRPADNELSADEKARGWRLLFNGKDLDGWECSNGKPIATPVEEGCLVPYQAGGYLIVYKEATFGDFRLKCDVKMGSDVCNSGVFFRVGDLLKPVQTGFEIQVAKKDDPYHDFGAIYDLVPPSQKAAKAAGQWNHIEITCRGPRISVVVNGQNVSQINCDEFDQPGLRPDGSKRKFAVPIKDMPRRGYLGFQNEGHKVWYKNVKVREI